MLESSVEARLKRQVELIGGKAYKLESKGNAGMPDRLICLPGGKVYFVETKRPKGGRLSKVQRYRIKELQALQANVRVINTYELVEAFIAEVQNGV